MSKKPTKKQIKAAGFTQSYNPRLKKYVKQSNLTGKIVKVAKQDQRVFPNIPLTKKAVKHYVKRNKKQPPKIKRPTWYGGGTDIGDGGGGTIDIVSEREHNFFTYNIYEWLDGMENKRTDADGNELDSGLIYNIKANALAKTDGQIKLKIDELVKPTSDEDAVFFQEYKKRGKKWEISININMLEKEFKFRYPGLVLLMEEITAEQDDENEIDIPF